MNRTVFVLVLIVFACSTMVADAGPFGLFGSCRGGSCSSQRVEATKPDAEPQKPPSPPEKPKVNEAMKLRLREYLKGGL